MKIFPKFEQSNKRAKSVNSIVATVCFSFTLFFFGPLHIYLTNSGEFSFAFPEILLGLLLVSVALSAVLFALLLIINLFLYEKVVALLCALAFLFWLQGNILLWNYGLLDGKDIGWASMWHRGIIDGTIWFACLAIALWKSSWIASKAVRLLCVSLIIIQCTSLTFNFVQHPLIKQQYVLDSTNKHTFSKERNVIIVVLDAFQSNIFQELIDQYPALQKDFEGFTYYRNAVSGFSMTHASIPNILTGKYYDNSLPYREFIKQSYLSESSLPRKLRQHNVLVDIYTLPKVVYWDPLVVSNLRNRDGYNLKAAKEAIYPAIFRSAPHFIKKTIYERLLLFQQIVNKAQRDDVFTFNDFIFVNEFIKNAKILGDTPTFKFYHLSGVHFPLVVKNKGGVFETLSYSPGNIKKVAEVKMEIVAKLLKKLKQIGIYSNSSIFIIADHGTNYPIKIPNNIKSKHMSKTYLSINNYLLPLVLFKPFGSSKGFKISDAPILLSDIPKTVLAELDIQNNQSGISLLDVKESEDRDRKAYFLTDIHCGSKYLSQMQEFAVAGFSWIKGSWRETGETFGTFHESIEMFEQITKKLNPFIKKITSFTNVPGDVKMLLNGNNTLYCGFPTPDPDQGAIVGLKVLIKGLRPGKSYKIRFKIDDTYKGNLTERFVQFAMLGEKKLYERDIGDGKYSEKELKEYVFTADSSQLEFNIIVQTVGKIEKGWNWGHAARIGIGDIAIKEDKKNILALILPKLQDESSRMISSPIFFGEKLELVSIVPIKSSVKPGESLLFKVTWKFHAPFPQDKVIAYYVGNGPFKMPPLIFKDTKGVEEGSLQYCQIVPGRNVTDIVNILIPNTVPPGHYELSTFVFPPDGYELPASYHSKLYPNQKYLFDVEVKK